ncbi:hypothetical protein ABLE91_09765 [Aquabacter sp. CN5-332]|uniref:hypothetical protein n=1 Tax=Aquabacter sp. CN5-332 TaxID=3156608 RepID=UPI0032B4D863
MSKARFSGSVMGALACLALGGCASTSDPSSLIPTQVQASVMAEDRLLGNPNGGGSVSVDDMLARARAAKADGSPGQAQAATAEPATGAPAASPQPTQPSPSGQAQTAQQSGTRTAPEPAEPKPFFEVTFDGNEDQPPAVAAEALAKKLKSARMPAKTEVTILTGPGPGTTAFDQALLANRRARNVRSLLPEGWKISQIYDPTFPPDTVRIMVGPSS